jgi:cell shape-determining protein MreC
VNPDSINPRWRRLRWTALGLLVLAGLATTAVARYRPSALQQRWQPVHDLLARRLLDPVRNRAFGALNVARRTRGLWNLDVENARLRHELARLETSNQVLREQLGRVERLTGLDQWGGPPQIAFLPADVVGTDTYGGVLLIVNRGERDGVRPRDPVVALGGLVGIVKSVAARSAIVQSVTDPLSVVGVIGVADKGARARGVVYGRGRNRPLEFFPENEVQPIEPGAVLISSGFKNSAFPKGLVIGVIEKPSVDPYGLLFGVVRPAVPPQGIEDVLVIVPASRAGGKALEPALAADFSSSAGQPNAIAMPLASARAWSGFSTATQRLLIAGLANGSLRSPTLGLTTATLAGVKPTSATLQSATASIAPGSTPETQEPPVPSMESWVARRALDENEWPAQWRRGGGE